MMTMFSRRSWWLLVGLTSLVVVGCASTAPTVATTQPQTAEAAPLRPEPTTPGSVLVPVAPTAEQPAPSATPLEPAPSSTASAEPEPAPERRVVRRPPPRAVPPDQRCERDADCTIFCPSARGCCPSAPCGCTSAVRVDRVDAIRAEFARSCTRPPRCATVGCMRKEAIGARCVQGMCRPTDGFGF